MFAPFQSFFKFTIPCRAVLETALRLYACLSKVRFWFVVCKWNFSAQFAFFFFPIPSPLLFFFYYYYSWQDTTILVRHVDKDFSLVVVDIEPEDACCMVDTGLFLCGIVFFLVVLFQTYLIWHAFGIDFYFLCSPICSILLLFACFVLFYFVLFCIPICFFACFCFCFFCFCFCFFCFCFSCLDLNI